MVQSGLTPMQALHAATGEAARLLKLSGKLGTLEPNAWADFGGMRTDPHNRKSNYLFCDGHVELMPKDMQTQRMFQSEDF